MKSRAQLEEIIKSIASDESPVGMDAVYVHALILDRLEQIEQRLDRLEGDMRRSSQQQQQQQQ